MITLRFSLLCCALALGLPLPALAQTNDNSQTAQRLDKIENDLMLLQRQVSRGEPVSAGSGLPDVSSANPAQLEVRLTAIEQSIRDLRGRVEQNEFEMKKVSDSLEKMQRDTDYRFSQLSAASTAAAPSAPASPSEAGQPPQAPVTEQAAPPSAPTGPTTAGDGVLRPPEASSGKEDIASFSTPRELYNYAFRLLNQTQYEEAASAFEAFTKKYPKDPLVGNAFYWGGETYYIRRDYVKAADRFRQGFEALPDGPKAADNLLKLAMSLDALNRGKEACVVLDQIVTKFRKSSTTVTEKAGQEQKRIGCK